MKAALRFFLPIALAAAAWVLGYFIQTQDVHRIESSSDGELLWLKKEFSLNPDQFRKIQKLHTEYHPLLNSLQERVAATGVILKKQILANTEVNSGVKKAVQEDSILRELCQSTLLDHMYNVAAEMPPKQAKKYITMLFPVISNMGRSGDF